MPSMMGYGAVPVEGIVMGTVNEIDLPLSITLIVMPVEDTVPVTVPLKAFPPGFFVPNSQSCNCWASWARRHVQSVFLEIRVPSTDMKGSGSDATAGRALNAGSVTAGQFTPEFSTEPTCPASLPVELDPSLPPPSTDEPPAPPAPAEPPEPPASAPDPPDPP